MFLGKVGGGWVLLPPGVVVKLPPLAHLWLPSPLNLFRLCQQWDDLGDFAWSPTTSASHRYAQIGSDLSMEATQDYQDRMDFWRGQVDT